MNIETIYSDSVTQYHDFLIAEINRIEQQVQAELQQARIISPEIIKAKHCEVLRQTQPLHDELVRLLSTTIPVSYVLSS